MEKSDKTKIEQVEYKTVDEQEIENHISDFTKRYNMITDLMFKEGGYQQGLIYLSSLFNDHFNMSDVLQEIGRLHDNMKDNLVNSSIVSKSRFYWGKAGHPYACLDKDLKFCVRIFGEEDWSDILYVFPYMNSTKAYDVSFKYEL